MIKKNAKPNNNANESQRENSSIPKAIVFTPGQERVLEQIKTFIGSRESNVFILKGYAGTGKTTLVKEILKIFKQRDLPVTLMASTGRAAKILSNATGHSATTVHSAIYTFTDFNQDLEAIAEIRSTQKVDSTGQLFLQFELSPVAKGSKQQYYIVDEASMVGDVVDKQAAQAMFGSGRLLQDLLSYDPNGKFIFVGDVCQLPPIFETISPALSGEYFLSKYKMNATVAELTEIVRQSSGNDIIPASHKVRQLYANPPQVRWGKFPLRGCRDIKIFSDQATMLNDYVARIKTDGYNQTTLICRSNQKCDQLTKLIRPALGLTNVRLQKDDLLLVTQNNVVSGLMNGDLVKLISIGVSRKRAHLTFLPVEVKELFTGKVYSQFLIEEILYGTQTNLTQTQQKELFMDYFYRMRAERIKQNDPRFMSGLRTDPYLNALRAVFGFALTCHKAQGGEWEHVYLDIPRNLPLNPTAETYQWLYTAMTRAKTKLYVVDDFYIDSSANFNIRPNPNPSSF